MDSPPTTKELAADAADSLKLDAETVESWMGNYEIDEYVVIDRYWIDPPFTYAEIQYNEEMDDHQYVIHDPDFNEDTTTAAGTVEDLLQVDFTAIDDGDYPDLAQLIRATSAVSERLNQVTLSEAYEIAHTLKHKVNPLGKLREMVADPFIASIDSSGKQAKIHVYHRKHGDMMSKIEYSEGEIQQLIDAVSEKTTEELGTREMTVNLDKKTVFTCQRKEIADTTSFSIHVYDRGNVSPVALVQSGVFSASQMAYLWEMMLHNANIAVIGGTAAGKSVVLNALANFIPFKTHIASIEDISEIELNHPYWTQMIASEEIGTPELIEKAVRARAEHIILDELRGGKEGEMLFEAATTNHPILFSMHANSPKECIVRLTTAPLKIPETHIAELDVTISLSEYIRDGENTRRCDEITELTRDLDVSSDNLISQTPISTWSAETEHTPLDIQNSSMIEEIAGTQLLEIGDVENRIQTRREILEYMADHDYTDPSDITAIVENFIAVADPKSNNLNSNVGAWVTESISDATNETSVTTTE